MIEHLIRLEDTLDGAIELALGAHGSAWLKKMGKHRGERSFDRLKASKVSTPYRERHHHDRRDPPKKRVPKEGKRSAARAIHIRDLAKKARDNRAHRAAVKATTDRYAAATWKK